MIMHEREKAVLDALSRLSKEEVVLIGGYAVNVYAPPRFSIDCDLVVLGGLKAVEAALVEEGYVRTRRGDVPYGSYVRYANQAKGTSFDLLVDSVMDRQTKISFGRDVFEKHSRKRTTVGRVNQVRIEMRVVDPELLLAMKFVVGRRQDVRDLFMLCGGPIDWEAAAAIVKDKCLPELRRKRAAEIRASVGATGYRPSLQGAFGKIPDERYEACRSALLRFLTNVDW